MGHTEHHQQATHIEFLDAITAHDLDRLMACFAEDVHYEGPVLGLDLHGRDEVRATYAPLIEAMAPSITCLDSFTADDGSRALSRWLMRGTVRVEVPGLFPPGAIGRSFSIAGASILTLTPEQRIAHYTEYWNLSALLSQTSPDGAEPIASS